MTGSEGESLAPDYTLFGKVTSGMDVVDKINADGSAATSSTGTPPKLPPHRVGDRHGELIGPTNREPPAGRRRRCGQREARAGNTTQRDRHHDAMSAMRKDKP